MPTLTRWSARRDRHDDHDNHHQARTVIDRVRLRSRRGFERAITEKIHFRGDLRYFFGGDLVPDYWRLRAGLRFGLGNR
jgi:hypothetical protein